MLKTIVLAAIILLTTGTAISQNKAKYPRKVVIDSSLNLSEYYGDTVFLYEPGMVVKVGMRMMALESAEIELHAYKTLYSHCDSLRHVVDSTEMEIDTAFSKYEKSISDLLKTNEFLTEIIDVKDKDNLQLSIMLNEERKKTKRQKYVYGFSGGGIGLLSGIIFTLIVVR